jgi:hypothetical protein
MNKSNVAVVVIAIAFLLAVGNAQTTRTQAGGSVGRYQLLAGEHVVSGRSASFDNKDIFRIDTETGATSIFASGTDRDGKAYSEWLPIR